MSKPSTTQNLVTLAHSDTYYSKIMSALEHYGFDVHYTPIPISGEYRPIGLKSSAPIKKDFLNAFTATHKTGEYKAHFRFTYWQNKDVLAHLWLHELMHFHQDLHGLFLTPLIQPQNTIGPNESSYIEAILLCESIAATEAICASYRLYESGNPSPWSGALNTKDWKALAQIYASDREQNISEEQAASHCFKAFYEQPVCAYYKKKAEQDYRKTIAPHLTEARSINIAELAKQLPETTTTYAEHIKENQTAPEENGHGITIGSPAYLWNTYIAD